MIDKDDIARMAREAGFSEQDGIITGGVSDLERFAALVAAAECEACAMVCEEVGEHSSLTPLHCAESIRARNET